MPIMAPATVIAAGLALRPGTWMTLWDYGWPKGLGSSCRWRANRLSPCHALRLRRGLRSTRRGELPLVVFPGFRSASPRKVMGGSPLCLRLVPNLIVKNPILDSPRGTSPYGDRNFIPSKRSAVLAHRNSRIKWLHTVMRFGPDQSGFAKAISLQASSKSPACTAPRALGHPGQRPALQHVLTVLDR